MKNNKGITLIALIITIIVMLILAAVTINMIIGEDGIINQGKNATYSYKEQEKIEKLLIENQFKTNANGEKYTEENIKDIIKVEEKTEVSTEKLTTYYDKYYKRDFVVYRYELTTSEEREKLEANGIRKLMGDVNFNGIVSEEDTKIITTYLGGTIALNEEQKKLSDIDGDLDIKIIDAEKLNRINSGAEPLYQNWLKYEASKKTGISEEKLVEYKDLCTEKYYCLYRYELTTDEERIILENAGIKMLKGDINFDGIIDINDENIIINYLLNVEEVINENELIVGDLNNSNKLDDLDQAIMSDILHGNRPLYDEWKK